MRIISGAAECGCQCTTRELTESWQVIRSIGSFPYWQFLMAWEESCGEMAASATVEALGGFYEENKKASKKSRWFFSQEPVQI